MTTHTLRARAGRVIGRDHILRAANCQDAFALIERPEVLVGVVCDGCGEGAHSEVGATLGAAFISAQISRLIAEGVKNGVMGVGRKRLSFREVGIPQGRKGGSLGEEADEDRASRTPEDGEIAVGEGLAEKQGAPKDSDGGGEKQRGCSQDRSTPGAGPGGHTQPLLLSSSHSENRSNDHVLTTCPAGIRARRATAREYLTNSR